VPASSGDPVGLILGQHGPGRRASLFASATMATF
jgi:hypothetical protein